MIARAIRSDIEDALKDRIAVILDGLPRVGRTVLAASWTEEPDSLAVTFDASAEADRQCFILTGQFLELVTGHLVVIENVDSRSIDAIAQLVRQAGSHQTQTRFLLIARLQSQSRLLAQQIAGHVRVIEVAPIQPDEAFQEIDLNAAPDVINLNVELEASPTAELDWNLETHWLRGGFPESLRAASDELSFQWRNDYLGALLNGDFSDWEISPGDRVPDLVARIVGAHGQIFDEEKCRSDLSIDRNSVRRSIDMLIRIGLVRRLPNWVKGHPVLYVRDAGLFHTLHGIRTVNQLRADDALGHSWEAFAAEALIAATGGRATASYYRDKAQNEIDLVLDFQPAYDARYAIEFKNNPKEQPRKGFWPACEAVAPSHRLLVHPGQDVEDHGNGLLYVPLLNAIGRVQAIFGRAAA